MAADVVTRFAPAPTGFLHLGHVVNAICVWRLAAARGGRVLLRIEDHDRQRSRPEYEAAIVEDLAWLGFVADGAPVRQSDRDELYASALGRLRAQGLVYACECSRHDVVTAGGGGAGELRYPGTCAAKGLADGPGRGLRVHLPADVLRFDDGLLGPQTQQPSSQCGDLLVRDRDGQWTYQFAAAVDDFVQRVTIVVRGEDLLASTGRQILLSRLLGRQAPAMFAHHPLVMKSRAQKLSKSDGDTGVRDLRAAGWTPEEVRRAAIEALGPSAAEAVSAIGR